MFQPDVLIHGLLVVFTNLVIDLAYRTLKAGV